MVDESGIFAFLNDFSKAEVLIAYPDQIDGVGRLSSSRGHQLKNRPILKSGRLLPANSGTENQDRSIYFFNWIANPLTQAMGCLDRRSMRKNFSLDSFASINSGIAVDRSGGGALAVAVGDVGAKELIDTELGEVALAGDDARLKDSDILISLRGKRNGSSVFKAARFEGRPVYASLDVAVIRLRQPDQMNALALSFWFNLESTQRLLSVHRVGSHAFRLPLPALRKFEVPHFTAQTAELFMRAGVAGRQVIKLEREIADRREIVFEEMMTQAVAKLADDAGRED